MFKYVLGEAPKVSMIGGRPVITVKGKIVYFRDPSKKQNQDKQSSSVHYPCSWQSENDKDAYENSHTPLTMVDDQDNNGAIPNGIVVKESTQNASQNDDTGDITGEMTEPLLTSNERKKMDSATISGDEDDNVFVVCADVEPPCDNGQFLKPATRPAPRIEITSDEDETIVVNGEPEVNTENKVGIVKPKCVRSMSEHQPEITDEDNEIETLPRSTSETLINGTIKDNPTGGALKRWLFAKLFTKSRERLRSSTNSKKRAKSSSSSMKSQKSTSSSMKSHKSEVERRQSELTVPFSLQRSGSDTTRNRHHFISERNSLEYFDDELPSAVSDTVITANSQGNILKKLKHKSNRWLKRGGTEVRFDVKPYSEHSKVELTDPFRRAYSDKSSLRRCPSIEKLDRRKRRKLHQNKTHTHAELMDLSTMESGNAVHDLTTSKENLEFNETDFNRRMSLSTFNLYRSVSDPCLTFSMIESKVANRTATKKWKRRRPRRDKIEDGDDDSDNLSALLRDYEFSSRPSSKESLGEPFDVPFTILKRPCIEFELSKKLVRDNGLFHPSVTLPKPPPQPQENSGSVTIDATNQEAEKKESTIETTNQDNSVSSEPVSQQPKDDNEPNIAIGTTNQEPSQDREHNTNVESGLLTEAELDSSQKAESDVLTKAESDLFENAESDLLKKAETDSPSNN